MFAPLTATDRYLARLIWPNLAMTMSVACFLLLLDKMRRLFDFVVQEGGPVSVVWKMLANLIPEFLGLGIPLGLMLGILLAFRKLAVSSELDVLLATGQGYARLLRVPYLFTIGFAILNLAVVGFIQPISRYAFENLNYELRKGAFGESIKVGEFTSFGKGMTLRIASSQNNGNDLTGIFVRFARKSGETLAVTAEHGQFLATDNPDTIVLHLQNGVMIDDAPGFTVPRVLSFTNHDLPINLPKIDKFRERGGAKYEKTLPELIRVGADPHTPFMKRNELLSNFWFRIAEILMMFLMPLLALAMAVPPKRSQSFLGFFLSVIVVVAYHKINEYAETIGSLGDSYPIVALGVPFLLFALWILWMYHILAHKPGGQPIGAAERLLEKLLKGLKRLVRMMRHEPQVAS